MRGVLKSFLKILAPAYPQILADGGGGIQIRRREYQYKRGLISLFLL